MCVHRETERPVTAPVYPYVLHNMCTHASNRTAPKRPNRPKCLPLGWAIFDQKARLFWENGNSCFCTVRTTEPLCVTQVECGVLMCVFTELSYVRSPMHIGKSPERRRDVSAYWLRVCLCRTTEHIRRTSINYPTAPESRLCPNLKWSETKKASSYAIFIIHIICANV